MVVFDDDDFLFDVEMSEPMHALTSHFRFGMKG
jgi:hypothetical protein